MASPQCEDGFTKIANEIMEALCRFRIPGQTRQVVDAIIRKTYGWHKTVDWVSQSQIVLTTRLLKGNVSRELSKAITHHLIIKNGNKLKFNKNHEEWVAFGGKHFNPRLSEVITNKKVIGSDNKVIATDKKVIVTEGNKRNYTKDNIYNMSKALKFKKLQEEKKELTNDLSLPKGGAFYEWQDRAARIARQLNFRPSASWFKFFKNAYSEGKRDLLNTVYSKIADLSLANAETYFYKTFNELKKEQNATSSL